VRAVRFANTPFHRGRHSHRIMVDANDKTPGSRNTKHQSTLSDVCPVKESSRKYKFSPNAAITQRRGKDGRRWMSLSGSRINKWPQWLQKRERYKSTHSAPRAASQLGIESAGNIRSFGSARECAMGKRKKVHAYKLPVPDDNSAGIRSGFRDVAASSSEPAQMVPPLTRGSMM